MRLTVIIIGLVFFSGCSSINYYSEIVGGHLDIISKTEDIDDVLKDNKTTEKVKKKLRLVKDVKKFAVDKLYLPDNDSYTEYVDLKRDYVLWSVVATPELSIKPYKSCFLIVGCMNYRGFFNEESAEEFANDLKEKGFDVSINGVAAYSTLGWFDDPVTNTMTRWRDTQLAGLIFHELTHQKLYIDSDTTFNESLAVTIQYEGIVRWLKEKNEIEAIDKYKSYNNRRKQFLELVLNTHNELKELYESELSDEQKRAQKKTIFEKMKSQYAELKKSWDGYSGYDNWFNKDLDNAKLALISTYNGYVEGFKAILNKDCEGDVKCFFNKVSKLSEKNFEERKEKLTLNP